MTIQDSTATPAFVVSPKLRGIALALCFFLGICGICGVHRFYVGKIGTGILMLITIGGLGVWLIYDLIIISFGHFEDKEGRRLVQWTD